MKIFGGRFHLISKSSIYFTFLFLISVTNYAQEAIYFYQQHSGNIDNSFTTGAFIDQANHVTLNLDSKVVGNNIFIDAEVLGQQKIRNEFISCNPNQSTFNFFTHGKPGELLINGEWLNPKKIANFLISNHDTNQITNLNIYGCEFAKGEKGKQAVSYLETTLGISVAASNDITGKDGNWELEVGKPISSISLSSYQYSLQATLCNDANGLYQSMGPSSPEGAGIYRYDYFTQGYLKIGVFGDNIVAGNPEESHTNISSAYNATTDYVYSGRRLYENATDPNGVMIPAGPNYLYVYNPADNYAYVGAIEVLGLDNGTPTTTYPATAATFGNTSTYEDDYDFGPNLLAYGDFVSFYQAVGSNKKWIRIDVTGITSYPTTVTATLIDLSGIGVGANDFARIENKAYGISNNHEFVVVDLIANTTIKLPSANFVVDNTLDGVSHINNSGDPSLNGWGAAWADRHGTFYVFNNVNGGIYSLKDIDTLDPASQSFTITKVLVGAPSGSNDGFGCPSGASPFDFDDDGIDDTIDIDDDDDGILDINESGVPGIDPLSLSTNGVSHYLDIVLYADTNGDGIADTFDFDLDGVPDAWDIDSDNDGILDNVESQTLGGYIAPSGTDNDEDGLDDAYDADDADMDATTSIGIVAINTDATGLADHLDLDADDDGCFDAIEGSGSILLASLNIDGSITDTTDVNRNGLLDVIEPGQAIGDSKNAGVDTDNDGISDTCDLDSDNDGILNTEEDYITIDAANAATVFSENSISGGGGTGGTAAIGSDNSKAIFNDTSDFLILELSDKAFPVGAKIDIESLTNTLGNILGVQESLDGTTFTESLVQYTYTGTGSDEFQEYTIKAPARFLRFTLETKVDTNILIDNVSFSAISYSPDTDGDGILDHLDLDSDNDGIPDIVEAGGTDTDGNGVIDAINTDGTLVNDTDNDGLDDLYDSNNGGTQITNPDTDSDGIADRQDLDADNDGIPDILEAGGTDADRDGLADNFVDTDTDGFNDVVDGDVGQDGTSENTANALITTGTDGDTDGTPDTYPNGDFDSDGILNHLDLDADNDGIPDNIEGQSTQGYVAPSNTFVDLNKNGIDDAYDNGAIVGVNPENTDATGNPDYLDLDADDDGLYDVAESGSGLTNDGSGVSTGTFGTNGLNDLVETGDTNLGYTDVNGEYDNTQIDNFTDTDSDVLTGGDVDYRDTTASGTPMITQVYQFGTERWIEITNIHGANSIPANSIKIQLYKDKTGDQTGVIPTATYTVATSLAPGESVLFKSSSSSITNIKDVNSTVVTNNALTDFDGANDIITLSTTTDATSWANRYDVIANFADKTSYVRIDETLLPNTTYTPSEWVVFIDDELDPYQFLGAGGAERHPHDPLISEIESSNTEANTLLGLHRINITTRVAASSGSWDNGYPDRSRFVVIDNDYNHSIARLSARKLTINAAKKLFITDQLLVVTNNILLNGEIRLINPAMDGAAQLIQTHTSASLVAGSGQLLVDQNSMVPSIYRYNYIGSPVKSSAGSTTYTVDSILKDGTTPTNDTGVINTEIAKDINWIGGYDGNFINSPTSSISIAKYWIYTYAANSGSRAFWEHKYNNLPIPNTDGFILKGPGRGQNYTFLGTPKDGNLTTNIGKDESYLVGNPFSSAISVKKFIEDNDDSLTGTLYFWEHVGEEVAQGIAGHSFAGYIGGYATVNLLGGVTAKSAVDANIAAGSVDINLEAELAEASDGNTAISLTVTDNSTSINVVQLSTIGSLLKFKDISRGADTLKIRYKSTTAINITLKVEGEFVKNIPIILPSSSGVFDVLQIKQCVEPFDDISIIIDSNNPTIGGDPVFIDFVNLFDADGQIACAPNLGVDDFSYNYTEPKPYIPIGQGFFVEGDATDGGTIVFNNSQREYKKEGSESVFFKTSSKKPHANSISNTSVIKLGMDFNDSDSGEKYHRQIAIGFTQHTSFDYDKGYDSEIYDIGRTDFYWKFPSDQRKFVIAGVQEISSDLEVPLEIAMGYAGTVNIKVDELKNVTENLYINDKLNKQFYPIINAKATLTLDQGTYTDRFVLAFRESTALNLEDDILIKHVTIFADNTNHNLIISKNEEVIIKNVELYNILGKNVSIWKIKEQKNAYQLKIKEQLATGVYIARINTNKGKINKKVVIE